MESCKESTVDADNSIDTLGEDDTPTSAEGGVSGGQVEEMIGEEESGKLGGESGTLAVSVVKCEEIFEDDKSALSGSAEGLLSAEGDGCP